MEQLKKISEACRQHYEKLILVLALVLLGGAVWYLYTESQKEKQAMEEVPREVKRRPGKLLATVNPARFVETSREATNPPALNFSGKHNLFNPVKWQQQKAGEKPIKVETGKEVGVESLQIVRVQPLNLTIAFERVITAGSPPDLTISYHTVVTNELATIPRLRRLTQYVKALETNSQVFLITEVKGSPEAPTEFVATLRDYNNESITFGPAKPYTRAVGYEAELKYPTQSRNYPRLRKESAVDIDGEPYKVVDITPTRVVLSDDSNGKRYAIEQFAAP